MKSWRMNLLSTSANKRLSVDMNADPDEDAQPTLDPATMTCEATKDPEERMLKAIRFPLETVTKNEFEADLMKQEPEDDDNEG